MQGGVRPSRCEGACCCHTHPVLKRPVLPPSVTVFERNIRSGWVRGATTPVLSRGPAFWCPPRCADGVPGDLSAGCRQRKLPGRLPCMAEVRPDLGPEGMASPGRDFWGPAFPETQGTAPHRRRAHPELSSPCKHGENLHPRATTIAEGAEGASSRSVGRRGWLQSAPNTGRHH